MYEYIKPKGFRFTLKHLGILIACITACIDIYSVYAFITGIKIYPFNFLFWTNPFLGIGFCIGLPILIYWFFYLISFLVTTRCRPEIKRLFDGEPYGVKYYVCEKATDSHYKIEINENEFIRIKKPEITYLDYPDVVVEVSRFTFGKELNLFERFCVGPVDNQLEVKLILPRKFLDRPEEYLVSEDISLKQFDDIDKKYKKEFNLKPNKNTYEFMDKISEFLEAEKQERKAAKKAEEENQKEEKM